MIGEEFSHCPYLSTKNHAAIDEPYFGSVAPILIEICLLLIPTSYPYQLYLPL